MVLRTDHWVNLHCHLSCLKSHKGMLHFGSLRHVMKINEGEGTIAHMLFQKLAA